MDKISFTINEPYKIESSSLKGFEIDVYLNDKLLPHSIFNAAQVIPASGFNFAEFDLFTCSCGVPGCAGFHYQVIQNKTDKSVVWNFPETDDYKTEKKVYEFDGVVFTKEFKSLLKNILQLEAEDIFYTTAINERSVEYKDNRVENLDSITKAMDYYKENFHAIQAQHDFLMKEFPEICSQQFVFIYDGKKSKYDFTLKDLIGKILNKYPHKLNKSYLAQCQQAGQAINNSLQGKNSLFYELAKKGYSKNGLNAHSMVEWLFDNLKEEDFDLNKLSIQRFKE